MLTIVVPGGEWFNPVTQEFVYPKDRTIQLEHSLVSVSKWESKYKRAFLNDKKKTTQEYFDYIKFMTVTQNVPDEVFNRLTEKNIIDIIKYINEPQTATVINTVGSQNESKKDTWTSELIYYYMFKLGIDISCQKWHLSRLIKLIEVFSAKDAPKDKKMTKQQAANTYASIEERNRRLLAKYKQGK